MTRFCHRLSSPVRYCEVAVSSFLLTLFYNTLSLEHWTVESNFLREPSFDLEYADNIALMCYDEKIFQHGMNELEI